MHREHIRPLHPGVITVSGHSEEFCFVFTDPAFSQCYPKINMVPAFNEVTVQNTFYWNISAFLKPGKLQNCFG
jgi:hypothetical protein